LTGPYKINGIPMRRVNPAYVIATSTSVDLSGVKIPDTVNDAYFRASKKAAATTTTDKKEVEKKGEKKEGEKKKEEKKQKVTAARVADQKTVDEPLIANIKKVPQLSSYLSSVFSLKNGDFPHLMKF
jgi:large subunit ribosomal protein L6e